MLFVIKMVFLKIGPRIFARSLCWKPVRAICIDHYQAFQLCMRCNSVISTKFHCFRADNSTSLCNSKRYLSVSSKQYAGSKDGEEKSDEAVPEEKPVSVKSRLVIVTVFALVGVAFFYYSNEKSKTEKLKKREVEMSKVDIGADDYELTDNTGKRVTKKNFLGKWLLLYFGFTHCPDICPEELERMSDIVDIIDNDKSIPNIQPIFISVDPDRDTPEAITTYLSDFHSKFIGLTGTSDEIKRATKAFRVYYQAGPKDEDNDYIVDHTIVMYLMNPKGLFVDYYGSRSVPINKIVTGIKSNMQNYQRLHG